MSDAIYFDIFKNMNAEEYLKQTMSICMRIENVLSGKIGDKYNKETFMAKNSPLKAEYNIRLYLAQSYDNAPLNLYMDDKLNGYVKLVDKVSSVYSIIDSCILEDKKQFPALGFLRADKKLSDAEWSKIVVFNKNLEDKAKDMFSSSLTALYENLAYRYKALMNYKTGYSYMPIFARLDLYFNLLNFDESFAGCNFEKALFVRKREHDEALKEEGHERMTLLIAEALLDAVTGASDDLEELKTRGDFAALYLSSRMEKGKGYTYKELSALLGLDLNMVRALYIIPALASDRFSFDLNENGEEIISLIW